MNEHALKLLQYNTWANIRVYGHLRQLPKEAYRQQIKSVFPTIAHVLQHLYIIDKGWHSVLTKQYAADDYATISATVNRLINETNDLPLHQLELKHLQLAKELEQFISTNESSRKNTYAGVEMSLMDVIVHVVNHGSYHRGNITAMLHQLGHSSIPTDYGYYLYTLEHLSN
jgi:uncharacterized damage-inducible protein DinB